jgi:uncharacterized membrane protein YhdT
MSRAVLLGLAVFVIGVGFVVADVVPFFFAAHDRPLWLNLACLLAPLGFAVALWAALHRGRQEQRGAVRQLGAS